MRLVREFRRLMRLIHYRYGQHLSQHQQGKNIRFFSTEKYLQRCRPDYEVPAKHKKPLDPINLESKGLMCVRNFTEPTFTTRRRHPSPRLVLLPKHFVVLEQAQEQVLVPAQVAGIAPKQVPTLCRF